MREYLYFYRYTDDNFRKVILTPNNKALTARLMLSDIEGILITKDEVPFKEHTFSITKFDDIVKKYNGRILRFEDFSG